MQIICYPWMTLWATMKNIVKVLVTSMSNMIIGWKLLLSAYRIPDYARYVRYILPWSELTFGWNQIVLKWKVTRILNTRVPCLVKHMYCSFRRNYCDVVFNKPIFRLHCMIYFVTWTVGAGRLICVQFGQHWFPRHRVITWTNND